MAVLVKDFSWNQTGEHVVVKVPLKGVPASSLDIMTYNTYIKASFKPFIFEVFLSHPIQDSSSKCTVSNGEIEFHLEKLEKNVHWRALCADLSREEKVKAREEVVRKVQDRSQQKTSARQELQQMLQRKAVQQQIEMEADEKKKVDQIRNTERNTAMAELEAWKMKQTSSKTFLPSLNTKEDIHYHSKIDSNNIFEAEQSSSEEGSQCDSQSDNDTQLTKDDLRPVPIPRSSGSIKIKFTPRAFPTPQRESQMEEEQAWLKKQAAAQLSVGFVPEDLRPEECNPLWLKEKGDSFFKVGNYLGAVSAYSHGIKLSKEMASLYVNRSAAHYALGNLQRVIEDCSTALDLMTPKVTLNEDSRVKCHVRRGAALCKLGMLKPALADLQVASIIKPDDQKLQTDIEDVIARLAKSEDNVEKPS